MFAYIIRRLIIAVVVLLLVTLIIFLIMHLLPGDPVLLFISQQKYEQITPEELALATAMLALIAVPVLAQAQKVDLVKVDPKVPGGGFVVFNGTAGADQKAPVLTGANQFECELVMKGVEPNTTYDIYLFIMQFGVLLPLGTITTNAAGNANLHHNCPIKRDGPVPAGTYNVGVKVTLHDSPSDLYLTKDFYGTNSSATVILK